MLVKLDDSEPFAKGAMRAAFRMKMMGKRITAEDRKQGRHLAQWNTQKRFAAKQYMGESSQQDILNDVMMQQEAKLLADAFNSLHPPKQVDFLDGWMLTLDDTGVCYFVEAFVPGDYKKHNNNAGYVGNSNMSTHASEAVRSTPQAFSHFTFVHSGGRQMCVDIQGVNELFTDPQIHTLHNADTNQKGDMGLHGFGEFFRTHVCNNVCRQLRLPPIPLHENELKAAALLRRLSKSDEESQAPKSSGLGVNSRQYALQ